VNEIIVFDRKLKKLHRDRAVGLLANHDFLLREATSRLTQHLEGISKEFQLALDLGGRGMIDVPPNIKKIIRTDASIKNRPQLVADEEFLPFKENSFDLILSLLSLHWVNDLPGALIQIRRILKGNGLFIGSMFGPETLSELRQAIMAAEMDAGISPRVSPFADIKTAAGLLQRAGFSMPVADAEKITVLYPDAYKLMHDLRGMGEGNALVKRRKNFTARGTMKKIGEKYREMFVDKEGLIPATFEIITLTGTRD